MSTFVVVTLVTVGEVVGGVALGSLLWFWSERRFKRKYPTLAFYMDWPESERRWRER